jgi:hypothetical protein
VERNWEQCRRQIEGPEVGSCVEPSAARRASPTDATRRMISLRERERAIRNTTFHFVLFGLSASTSSIPRASCGAVETH